MTELALGFVLDIMIPYSKSFVKNGGKHKNGR